MSIQNFALTLFTTLFLLALAPTSQAGNSQSIVPANEFLSAMNDLRADLEEGIPRDLNRREWRDFDRIHNRFKYLLSGTDDAKNLPNQAQIELYNLQNQLDGLVMGGMREQLVCTEQRTIGSRIPRRNCRTVEEIEEERVRAREWLGRFPFQLEGPQG